VQTRSMRSRPAHAYHPYEADSLRVSVRGILRSLPIVILCAAVAVGGAIAYARTRPTTYRTTASLLFNDAAYQQVVAGGYNPVDAQRRLKTSADVIGLPAVAQRAMREARRQPGFRAADTHVKTEYSLDANTMRVVATGRDPRSPGLLANATAAAFLAYRDELSANSLQEAREVLAKQIDGANTRTERRQLVAKRNNLDAMKALDDRAIQLAQRASVPAAASDDDKVRIAVIAGVLGALVGIGIALLRAREPLPPPLRDPWVEEQTASDRV
jgi:LPS O-antigen subunit length determinant protein (WzzB/FepE family)